jgi:hypothetical protein
MMPIPTGKTRRRRLGQEESLGENPSTEMIKRRIAEKSWKDQAYHEMMASNRA